jgi:hypothetical protein
MYPTRRKKEGSQVKEAQVKVGETYLTKVNGSLRRVVVVQHIPGETSPGYGFAHRRKARFVVRLQDKSNVLAKWRTAQALRVCSSAEADMVTLVAFADGSPLKARLDADIPCDEEPITVRTPRPSVEPLTAETAPNVGNAFARTLHK